MTNWKLILCVPIISSYLTISFAQTAPTTSPVPASIFAEFNQTLTTSDEAKIERAGDKVFEKIAKKYEKDEGFTAFRSRLNAAEYLSQQMVSQLTKTTKERIATAIDDILDSKEKRVAKKEPTLYIPAKEFYDMSVKVFTTPVQINSLNDDEKKFLVQYYNMKLKNMIQRVGKAGISLTVADSNFKGTHDYILVLPMLHIQGDQPVDTENMPRWLQKPDQLLNLSDSCLLHYGLPCQAMILAKTAAEIQKKPFKPLDYYQSAAQKCSKTQSQIAVRCLLKAIECIPTTQQEAIVDIQMKIFQTWWDAAEYGLAGGQAKMITQTYPKSSRYDQAMELYFTALANMGNAPEILSGIDTAITDKRCSKYIPQLQFIKWWALRKTKNQSVVLTALEETMVKNYGDDPIVAPILFSQAMDFLANQDYTRATELFTQVVDKFPSTRTAAQAKRILQRLETVKTRN